MFNITVISINAKYVLGGNTFSRKEKIPNRLHQQFMTVQRM